MIPPNTLSSLLKVVQNSTPQTTAKLTKLLDVEVLQSLGKNRYLLKVEGSELTALSRQKLTPYEHYFAKFETTKDAQPTLSHLIKIPKLFTKLSWLQNQTLYFEPKDIAKLLGSKEALHNFKDTLLKELATSPSKEHFQTLMPFLLSLHHNVLSIPLQFYDTFAFLQLKKRYNKKTKKSFLHFYAFFTHLGPISGTVSEERVTVNVAFEETKKHLTRLSDEIGYAVHIEVADTIAPLFETKTERILDITT